jgi:hypothetical protein
MSEPFEREGAWWNRSADGSWLRWNAAEYRWDPHPSGPEGGEPPAAPATAAAPVPRERPSWAVSDAAMVRDYESAVGKARAAVILVALTSAGFVGEAILLLGSSSSLSSIVRSSASLSGISRFLSLAFLASAVTVIIWCKGAYDNASPLGASELRYKPGWAIAGWLVPVAFFFIPKQIVDDLWRTASPELPPEEGSMWKGNPVPGIFHWWWALWCVRWVLLSAGNGMIRSAVAYNDVDQFTTAVKLVGVSDLFTAGTGLLLVLIIRKPTARQDERARALAASSPERARALGVAAPQ